MAPVQLEPQTRYDLAARVPGHVLTAVWLTFEVGRSLYRSYRGLGPAQDTRERLALRSKLLPTFAILAVVSLGCAAYASIQHATLSYRVWASQRDMAVPARLYGDKGILPFGENATDVYLARWLTDTSVYTDAIDILAEKARRFWWGQQIDLGMVSWSMLLAIEGRRRNIPLLWCYQLLGQLVSLSYGQNLFFLALLLTPAPLPQHDDGSLPVSRYVRTRDAIFPPKPANWTPHPLLYVAILLPNFAAIALSTFVANTPSLTGVFLAARGLTLAPLILPYVVPVSWGSVHSGPHEIYGTYGRLFKVMAMASFVLHAKATVAGLIYNAPDAHYHRHSIHLPFDTERRSSWERTTSAFGKILEATSDHPVVSSVGWDVLLSTLSIGIWAAVRGTDVSSVLASSMPLYQRTGSDSDDSPEPTKQTKQTGGDKASTTGTQPPTSPKRRGRQRKAKDEALDNQAYEPTASEAAEAAEGDVLPDMGWDSTALAWGMTALGGLGLGSAGVFGSECVAR